MLILAVFKMTALSADDRKILSDILKILPRFSSEDCDDWKIWCDQFNDCLALYGVSANSFKRHILLLLLSGPPMKALKNLCLPKTPADLSPTELLTFLDDFFESPDITIAQRGLFDQRNQEEGESLDNFVYALKDLAVKSKFSADFDSRVRDRFVNGLLDAELRFYLATQVKDISGAAKLASVVQIAKQYESTKAACKIPNAASVGAVAERKSKRPASSYACHACGKSDHFRRDCYYKDAVCVSCGIAGHIPSSLLCKNNRRHQPTAVHQAEEDTSNNVDCAQVSDNFCDILY